MSLFELRGTLTATQRVVLGLAGLVVLLVVWWVLAEALGRDRPIVEGYNVRLDEIDRAVVDMDSLARADSLRYANATEFERVYPILPPPLRVVQAYPRLISRDGILSNALQSIWLNLRGYFWAVLLSLGVGFVIGLVPLFRGLFSGQVNALRYLPLTALTGLFIVWFGIDDNMKIAFLAFGILVYMLPVVVQRIDEVRAVYLQTVYTLGATDWQTVKSVYLPSVLSKFIDDIRVLTAISWTYIIIAEYLNRTGGLGAMIYSKQRMSKVPEMFAILLLIILIGFLQDRLFVYLDRRLFPHKYLKSARAGVREIRLGIFVVLGVFALAILLGNFLPAVAAAVQLVLWGLVGAGVLLVLFGEFKLQAAGGR